MKLVSWNVNGIRASMDKGFRDYMESSKPDVICLQETKAMPEQVDLSWADDLGYTQIWNCADKKGYSGVTIFSKADVVSHELGMGIDEHDKEGRVIAADMGDFQLVSVYTPNSQRGLKRLDYRMDWDKAFLAYMKKLEKKKPVIFCGDLNCAHAEIDLANPKSNRKNAGFTDEERGGLDKIIEAGFIDSFRQFDEGPGNYSWWTYRSDARERNIGWRLDYFWVSQKIWDAVKSASILKDVRGSDHCPVTLELG
ncbi:MAG: exodeoxyribonuclease-3 [Verrucomicrobiales bacterium]|jgi:exodeoxyribonuclease-3